MTYFYVCDSYIKSKFNPSEKEITTLCVTKIYITFADIYKTPDYFSRVSPRKKAQLIKKWQTV